MARNLMSKVRAEGSKPEPDSRSSIEARPKKAFLSVLHKISGIPKQEILFKAIPNDFERSGNLTVIPSNIQYC